MGYTCNIRRSLSRKQNQLATYDIYVVLKALKRNECATRVTFVDSLRHEGEQARYPRNMSFLSHDAKLDLKKLPSRNKHVESLLLHKFL